MPKDIMPKITYCPKTLCPIWQFAQEDILPKDFMPKVTICPTRTLCPRWYFAHIFEGFCLRIFGNIKKWKEIVTQSKNAWWVFFEFKLWFLKIQKHLIEEFCQLASINILKSETPHLWLLSCTRSSLRNITEQLYDYIGWIQHSEELHWELNWDWGIDGERKRS